MASGKGEGKESGRSDREEMKEILQIKTKEENFKNKKTDKANLDEHATSRPYVWSFRRLPADIVTRTFDASINANELMDSCNG